MDLERDLEALGRALPARPDPALVRRIVARLGGRHSRPVWPWAAGAAAAAAFALLLTLAGRTTPPVPAPIVREKPRPAVPDPIPVPPPAPERVKDLPPIYVPPDPVATPLPKPPPSAPVPPPVPPEPPAPVAVPPRPTESKPAIAEPVLVRADDRLATHALDGVALTLRPKSELRILSKEEVQLDRGEVWVDVTPGPGRRFAVLTGDARIQVTGTQFSVQRESDHTEIVVAGGEVAVSNDRGQAALPAGTGLSVRKSAAPGKPKPVDPDALTAWRRGPETPRFRYTFEDGRRPFAWTGGKVAAAAPRGLNRFALEGPTADADLTRLDRKATVVRPDLLVRFRYYAAGGTELCIQFFCERGRDNYRHDVRPLALGRWETVEVLLSRFARLADGDRLRDGDRLTWLNVNVANAAGAVWFDDLEVVETSPQRR